MGDELQVDLIVQAIDRASAVMNQVATNTAGLTTKTQEHTQAVQKGESVFTTFNQAMGAANQVMKISKQIWDSSVGSVISYDASIREVSAATGISSEETSKLIDLTDNFGISTGELMMAQKKLAGEGYSLNIDTLKELATQYNAMGTQAEKTTFLVNNFGRSGLNFAEMFDLGTEAMDKYYNGSADGMVRTAEQTRQTLLLTIAQKDLGDAWQGLTNKVVTPLIPQMTQGIQGATGELDLLAKSMELIFKGDFAGQQKMVEDYWKARDAGASKMIGPAPIAIGPKPLTDNSDPENLQGLADKYTEIIGLTQQVGSNSTALAATQGALQEKIAGVNAELDRAVKLGYSPAGNHIREIKKNLEDLTDQYQANEVASQSNTNKQVYSDYLKMNSSKQMTAAMFQQQQDLGVALGVFSTADAKTATKIYELEQQLQSGAISADKFAYSLKHVNDMELPAMSTTEQGYAQAYAQAGQQAQLAQAAQTPTMSTTEQGYAQAGLDAQAQAKKTQDAAKAATTAMSAEFTTFSGTVQKQADAAKSKVQELVDSLSSLGKFGTITISVTGGTAGGGAEYP